MLTRLEQHSKGVLLVLQWGHGAGMESRKNRSRKEAAGTIGTCVSVVEGRIAGDHGALLCWDCQLSRLHGLPTCKASDRHSHAVCLLLDTHIPPLCLQLLLKVGHHRKKPWTHFINDANRHLASPEALAFLDGCLRFDHQQRWTTQEALQQPYFDPVREEVAAQQERQRQEQQRRQQQQQRAQEEQDADLEQQQIDGQSMQGVEEDGEGAGDAAIAAAGGGGGRRSGTRPVPAPADQGRTKRVYARRKRQ